MLAAYYMEVFGILGKGAKETLPMLNEKPIIPNVDHNCTPNHFGQASPRAAESPLPKKFLPVPVSTPDPKSIEQRANERHTTTSNRFWPWFFWRDPCFQEPIPVSQAHNDDDEGHNEPL